MDQRLVYILNELPWRIKTAQKIQLKYKHQTNLVQFLKEREKQTYIHINDKILTSLNESIVNFADVPIQINENLQEFKIHNHLDDSMSTVCRNDYIICGPEKELYTLDEMKVSVNYNHSAEFDALISKEVQRYVIQLSLELIQIASDGNEEVVRFVTPWNETMIAKEYDFISFESDLFKDSWDKVLNQEEKVSVDQIQKKYYRIALEAFVKTYQVI